MVAELVAAGAEIPGLGDQLQPARTGSWRMRVEEAGAGVEAMRLAAERGAEIETEAVDMIGLAQ